MWWLSTCAQHFVVPAGSNEYMSFTKHSQFQALGDVKDDWVEYDVSRLPIKKCCEYML
jgi:hypothetical protein